MRRAFALAEFDALGYPLRGGSCFVDWLIANKEWVFSGIGVMLLGLFIGRSAWQRQRSGDNSTNNQAGRDINVGSPEPPAAPEDKKKRR